VALRILKPRTAMTVVSPRPVAAALASRNGSLARRTTIIVA
jgi:hypothetical protein